VLLILLAEQEKLLLSLGRAVLHLLLAKQDPLLLLLVK
jgi:hypothetical protein